MVHTAGSDCVRIHVSGTSLPDSPCNLYKSRLSHISYHHTDIWRLAIIYIHWSNVVLCDMLYIYCNAYRALSRNLSTGEKKRNKLKHWYTEKYRGRIQREISSTSKLTKKRAKNWKTEQNWNLSCARLKLYITLYKVVSFNHIGFL